MAGEAAGETHAGAFGGVLLGLTAAGQTSIESLSLDVALKQHFILNK